MFSKLRHPIRSITEPFGKAGLIVAICALVLATTGAAFAAAGLNSKQKKEVTKIAKKYAGKPGAPGPTGPAGAAGTNGTNGTNGKDGTNGAPGSPGKSVVASTASGTECTGGVGGTKFEVEGSGSPSHVCNGKNGTTGFTEFLPSGKTETGVWSVLKTANSAGPGEWLVPISFTIPLATALGGPETHVVEAGQTGTGECEGGTAAEPTAKEGNLCVYIGVAFNFPPATGLSTGSPANGAPGTGKAGAVLGGHGAEGGLPEGAIAFGSWAVTAK